MVTIFHLLMLLAVVGGAALGSVVGWHLFEVYGAILDALAGLLAGALIGQVPLVAGMLMVGRRYEKMTTDALREHLHAGECSTPNLVLLELRRRGETIEDELPLLQQMLASEDVQQRTRGWAALRSAFPERATQRAGYSPFGNLDECRKHAEALSNG
jgi:hypothetical protein